MYFQISLGSQCLLSLLLHQTSFIGTFYVLFPIYIYCLEKKYAMQFCCEALEMLLRGTI